MEPPAAKNHSLQTELCHCRALSGNHLLLFTPLLKLEDKTNKNIKEFQQLSSVTLHLNTAFIYFRVWNEGRKRILPNVPVRLFHNDSQRQLDSSIHWDSNVYVLWMRVALVALTILVLVSGTSSKLLIGTGSCAPHRRLSRPHWVPPRALRRTEKAGAAGVGLPQRGGRSPARGCLILATKPPSKQTHFPPWT